MARFTLAGHSADAVFIAGSGVATSYRVEREGDGMEPQEAPFQGQGISAQSGRNPPLPESWRSAARRSILAT